MGRVKGSDKEEVHVIELELLPKQVTFINSLKKEVMFSGGVGSSKSVSLCLKAVQQAVIPGNVVVLCRKTLASLKNTTLRPLLYGSGDLPPILPHGSYTYNKSSGVIYLVGGGEIVCVGVDDEFRIRGLEAGCICIDEATELDKAEYMELFRRLRSKKTNLRQLCLATNPASPSHFLYKRFFTKKIKGYKNREVVTTSSYENNYLPKDYIDAISTMEGVNYDRYVKGLWVQSEGAIYDNFNMVEHVKRLPADIVKEWIIGADEGYTHPTAIIKCGVYGENRLHIFDEHKESKMIQTEIAEKICRSEYLNPIVIVDPSCASLIGALERRKMNVMKANNDVVDGISRVRAALNEGRLTIDPECTELIKEIQNYVYYKDTEKPVKVNDDLMDCVRYVQNYMDDSLNRYVKPVIYFGEDEWEEF